MLFVFIFLTGLLAVTLSIPPIITIALRKRLFDAPNESRKIHKRIVPNLGGIAIFTGFVMSCSLFLNAELLPQQNQLFAAGLILFMLGLKDDIIGLSPLIKFTAQFVSAFIIVMIGDVRIYDLQDILFVGPIHYFASIFLSVIFIVGVVNAFNLIDGIDGLAGTLGLIVAITFTFLFYQAGETGWSMLSLALAGSLIGFLIYNITPARIFMGDSGSLLIGFLAAVLGVKFININSAGHPDLFIGAVKIESSIGLVLAMLIVPIFDTLRVFTLRVLANESPFKADSNHMHHRLLMIGLNHTQSTLVLAGITLAFMTLAFLMQGIGNTQLIGLLILITLIANTLFSIYLARKIPAAIELDGELTEKATSKTFAERILERISQN